MHVSILDHFRHLNFDLSMSLKVKYGGGIGLPIYDFPLMFNISISPNSVALRDISLWNLSDFDIDLSMSLKVKCGSVIGLSIYVFLLIFISNNWPNSAPFQDIRLRNLEWPWILHFKVTQGQMWWCHWTRHIWFPIHIYSNHMSNSHCLALIATQKVISYLLPLGPNYENSQVHRMTSKWP